jgi:hypothetical protein
MEPRLYGPLGLTPITAGVFTPADLRKLYAGYLWREERKTDHVSALMVAIYQAAGVKRVSVKKLQGGRASGESWIDGYRKKPETP